MKLAFPQMCAQ